MKKQCRNSVVLIVFLAISFSGSARVFRHALLPDTLTADTNKLWFDKTNFLLVGIGAAYKDFDITFKNTTANIMGTLEFKYTQADFPYKIRDWNFFPNINQTNASAFVNTRYGSASYSVAVDPSNSVNFTKAKAFNISIPVKKFDLSFDYLKFTGLNRTEPVFNTDFFLKDLSFSSVSFSVEYRLGRLKNNLFYVPKKMITSLSFVVSGLKMKMENPDDFIPALAFKNDDPADSVIQVSGLFMNKFVSEGLFFGPRADFLIPIIKSRSNMKPNTLYLKGTFFYGLNSQKFEYFTLANTFSSVQYKLFMKGFGLTTNYYITGQLFYDFNAGVFNFGAVFGQQSYGKSNNGSLAVTNNHVTDQRITFTAALRFRIEAKKVYGKIDSAKKRVLRK